MMTSARWILGCLVLAVALPAAAGAEILLDDGSRIEARSVERRGDLYLVELDDDTLTLPVELVRQIRLFDGNTPPEDDSSTADAEPALLPTRGEQLRAFGRDPAPFVDPPVDTAWEPEDAYGFGSDVTQFHPAAFPRLYEFDWRPTSGFERTSGGPDFNPARWTRPSIDPGWRPRDAWGRTVWFPRLFDTRDGS